MIEIPMRIVSVQNERSHWAAAASRRKCEREAVGWSLKTISRPSLPVTVKLTRIAPRPLDSHDNLRHGFKAPVDAIASWLGVMDNDERVAWEYAQERGKPRQYAARIEFA